MESNIWQKTKMDFSHSHNFSISNGKSPEKKHDLTK
jgi:hypothetical protein